MRARNIKPGFFKNEYLAELSPEARILFIGLWCMADKEGRLEYRPKRIKAEVLPYDSVNIEKLLEELDKFHDEFIHIYKVGNSKYIEVVNFNQHQNPHKNEKATSIPPPSRALEDSPVISGALPEKHHTNRADSGYLNPNSLSLIPDSSSPLPEPMDSKPEPEGRGRGIFFKIKTPHEELSEEEWLFRSFLERKRSKGERVDGCDSLNALISLYPSYFSLLKRWQTLPEDIRMAAYAFVILETKANDQFMYALDVAENPTKYNNFTPYLDEAKRLVAKREYTVEID